MAPVLLLLPVGLLAGGAALAALFSRRLPVVARLVAAVAAWSALAAVLVLWMPTRNALDVDLGDLGAGVRLAVRLDAVSFAFSLLILLPSALLLTFAPLVAPVRSLLAIAAAVLAVQSAGLVLATFAIALGVGSVGLLLQGTEGGLQQGSRIRGEMAVLCLLWAATALHAIAGTDQFAFIPVARLPSPVVALVVAGALLLSGLVPWRPWPVRFLERFAPAPAALASAVLFPIGFSLLLRMYQAGGGHYPSRWFNIGLGAFGAAIALGAALRGQAAATRRDYLAESLPMAGGFALLALALGTPAGVAACVAILVAGALLIPLPALLPAQARRGAAITLALVTGLPPTLVFATRLLGVEAAVTANEVFAYAGIAVALAWLLGIAGAARALRLPSGDSTPGSAAGVLLTALLLATGGVLMGALEVGIANPAATTVMASGATLLGGGLLAVDTAAGNWPAVSLGLLVFAGLAVLGLVGRDSVGATLGVESKTAVAPIVTPTWRAWPDFVGTLVDSFEVPAEFRVTGWQSIDRAMARASVWFWVASFAVLAVALLR